MGSEMCIRDRRRTLHVFVRLDLLGDNHRLLVLYRCHLLLSQALLGRFVVSKIELCADQDDGDIGRMVFYFRVPLWTRKSTANRNDCVMGFVQYLRLDVVE